MTEKTRFTGPAGQLAKEGGFRLPLMVLESANGFYLGTADDSGPVSRESIEYWPTRADAEEALEGECNEDWSQRLEP